MTLAFSIFDSIRHLSRCNHLGIIFLGENCMEGNCPGVIVLGDNCPGGIILGENCLGPIFCGERGGGGN